MTVDERNRLQLAEALKRVLGDSEGITLMELLPPVGWADVATRHDLLALEQRIDLRFDASEERSDRKLDALESRLDAKISALAAGMDLRFAAVEARFAGIDHRFDRFEHQLLGQVDRRLRSQAWMTMSTIVAVGGVIVAAIRL